jgi:NFU1 iron-sulfur cluster scaffold homolog, mitochondrial
LRGLIQIPSEIDRRNPRICRFTSERTLYIGTKTFTCVEEAKGIPLAENLMQLAGVARIQLIGHLLVVTRTEDREWLDLAREIEAILTAYLISDQALTREEVQEQMMLIGKNTREKIQYLVDTQINPGVAEHGGAVQVVDIRDRNLYLRLHGGCQGCGAADFTLRQNIETIVRRAMPEIDQIIDLTNHSAGTNPYYQRADSRSAVIELSGRLS